MIHRKVIHQITNLRFKAHCWIWFRISVWALICQNLSMFSNNYSFFLQWNVDKYVFFIYMYVWWIGFCNLHYKKCTYAFSFVTLMWWYKFYKWQTSSQSRTIVKHCIVYSRRLFTLTTDSNDSLANKIVFTRSWNMMVSSNPPQVVVCRFLVN